MIQELHAALLQGVVILGTAATCWFLYARYRRRDLLWWSVAWTLYVLRIGAIVAFLETRAQPWLFVHQIFTGWTALVLLWAALTFSRSATWRPLYALALVFPVAWSFVATYVLQSFMLAAIPAVLFLSFATLWTGIVFVRQWRVTRSRGAAVLAGVLITWAIHHLDYPILRAQGAWNPWGYYLDILFVLAMSIGIGMLLLEQLDRRTHELERLSARIVRQHEDERRRVSLELHDQTAQVWAAVKLQLGLIREKAPATLTGSLDHVLNLVDTGIRSIRGVTTNLRPPLLEDLGLVPALRALTQDFADQTRLEISFEAPAQIPSVSSDAGLALYRALQEALSNVARHSGASRAEVRLSEENGRLHLAVRDNGRGLANPGAMPGPNAAPSLGITGMRERITALRGSVDLRSISAGGAALTITIPVRNDN
jgi:signal transduction histidine kinase